MSEATKSSSCPKCGGAIPPEAPQGLCPKCLLQQASFPTETGSTTRHSRPAPPDRAELAAAFPHLEILELIGQGGMGFVYKARQPKLDRLVALKILAQPLAEQTMFAERFTREGRTLAKLNHPNIVTIHDFGQAGPFFYLLMEYVDGVNLRQAMRAGAIDAVQALAIVPRICEALQYAHNEGVLHRDIKPDNILLNTRGRVKIADFGIAKLMAEAAAENPLTGSGASLGTPHYMAPEQIEKPNSVDHRADIYSLGVVFYEMLTGELPLGRFAAPSERSGSDPRLDNIVFQTLEKQPERRPQNADEVKTKVESVASTGTNAAKLSAQPARHYGERILKVAAICAVIALLAGAVSVVAYLNMHERRGAKIPAVDPDASHYAPTLAGPKAELNIVSIYSTNNLGIALRTSTEPAAGERFIPVIRYGNGPWGEADNAGTRLEYFRTPQGLMHNGLYTWTLPAAFNSGFEIAAAIMRARALASERPLAIYTNAVTPLCELTNASAQVVSIGLRLQKTNVPPQLPPIVAKLTHFGGRYGSENPAAFITVWGFPEIPPGYRIQAVALQGNHELTAKTYQSSENLIHTFYLPGDQNIGGGQLSLPSEIVIPLGEPQDIYSVKTPSGEICMARLELVPMPGTIPPKITPKPKQPLPEPVTAPLETIELTFFRPTTQPRMIMLEAHAAVTMEQNVVAIVTGSTADGGNNPTAPSLSNFDAPTPIPTSSRRIPRMSGSSSPNFLSPSEPDSLWRSVRGPTNENVTEFRWFFAESYSLERDLIPAVARFFGSEPFKNIKLTQGQFTKLFAITNAFGEISECGLQFVKSVPSVRDPNAGVIVTKFAGQTTRDGIHLDIGVAFPEKIDLEATADVDGKPVDAILTRNFQQSGAVSASWAFPEQFRGLTTNSVPTTFSTTARPGETPVFLQRLQNRIGSGDARITPDRPLEMFVITNGAGKVFRGYLQMARPDATNAAAGPTKKIDLGFDYFGPSPDHNINFKGLADLANDEFITTAIRYNDSDWSFTRFTSTWDTEEKLVRLHWKIPENFSIPFDLEPAVAAFFHHAQAIPIQLSTNGPLTLLTVTNALHQRITLGMAYTISSLTNSAARLSNLAFRATPGGIEMPCVASMPPGMALEAWSSYAGGSPKAVRVTRSMPGFGATIAWRYPEDFRINDLETVQHLGRHKSPPFAEGLATGLVTLSTNALETFAITNSEDTTKVWHGFLKIRPVQSGE